MPPIFDGSSHDLRSILSVFTFRKIVMSVLLFQFVPHLREVFLLQCRHLLTKTEMIEQLRREEYDAVIGETFDYCGFGHNFSLSRLSSAGWCASSVSTVYSAIG